MRVAFVSTLLPETNYFRCLALALQKIGEDVRVYADRDPNNLETGLKKVYLLWSRADRLYPFCILRQAFRDNPEVVHLHHEIGMFGGPINATVFPLVPLLLRIFGFRVVTTIHAVVTPKEIDKRFLETFAWPAKTILILPVRIYFRFLYSALGWFSHRLIVHSFGLKEILKNSYRIRNSKIRVIPHGVPDAVDKSSFESGGEFIFYWGYFHRRKGIEYLIEAFAKLAPEFPKTRLVLAGGTLQKDYAASLKSLAERLGISSKVDFPGFISEKELRGYLTAATVVALPATYSISASGPLAQVIAHEKPLVLTKLGVYSEEINDGINGLFCNPEDADDLARKIRSLLSDKGLRDRLSKGMAELHRERAWSKIAVRTVEVYRTITK